MKYYKLTAPYHPSTNGQAERCVQTVKDALRAMSTTESTLQSNINEFLRQYRKAPHATTGASPAQLFIGRDLRTRLNLVLPDDLHTKISEKQKASFDATYRKFHQGDLVYFLSENPRMGKWIVGEVVSCLGDLHYEIEFHGKRFKRHIHQIRSHEHSSDQGKQWEQQNLIVSLATESIAVHHAGHVSKAKPKLSQSSHKHQDELQHFRLHL
ncbi:uncharacterized protein K02A2.6-like [Agrilus planipennis]|uniref:Uncharacterized protein K02A2.6-like n=1 Tax=Agrilus planipennis TaxID=224129 RepID=A0A1W4WTC4_AGRPL|nr:uncharacterized protein K02A2.6-like [Agrilus planipennis]